MPTWREEVVRASIHLAGVKQPTNISRLHSKDLGKLKWSLEVPWASCPVTSPGNLVETQRPGPHRCIESDSQEEGRAICVLKSLHRPCRDTARIENLSSKSSFNFRIWGCGEHFLLLTDCSGSSMKQDGRGSWVLGLTGNQEAWA